LTRYVPPKRRPFPELHSVTTRKMFYYESIMIIDLHLPRTKGRVCCLAHLCCKCTPRHCVSFFALCIGRFLSNEKTAQISLWVVKNCSFCLLAIRPQVEKRIKLERRKYEMWFCETDWTSSVILQFQDLVILRFAHALGNCRTHMQRSLTSYTKSYTLFQIGLYRIYCLIYSLVSAVNKLCRIQCVSSS
jgi:hypothetical protein